MIEPYLKGTFGGANCLCKVSAFKMLMSRLKGRDLPSIQAQLTFITRVGRHGRHGGEGFIAIPMGKGLLEAKPRTFLGRAGLASRWGCREQLRWNGEWQKVEQHRQQEQSELEPLLCNTPALVYSAGVGGDSPKESDCNLILPFGLHQPYHLLCSQQLPSSPSFPSTDKIFSTVTSAKAEKILWQPDCSLFQLQLFSSDSFQVHLILLVGEEKLWRYLVCKWWLWWFALLYLR